MQNSNKIIKFTIPILVLLVIALSGCAGQPVLVETYDSTVSIEGIKDPQHVEHFSLITVDNETIIEDEFSPNNVENGELTYQLTGLEGDTDISLVVNNDQIEGSLYEENYQKTITPDNPDITINLDQTQPSYSVEFTDPEHGFINASVNEEKINSGDLVTAGSDIKFYVTPQGQDNEYFKVKNWVLNGNDIKEANTTFIYKNIQKNINVDVILVKISYFQILFDKENIDVSITDNEITANIPYKVKNLSDLDATQEITFDVNYVDDGYEYSLSRTQEVDLKAGAEKNKTITWNEIIEMPGTYKFTIASENTSVIFYITLNNEAEFNISYELPPSAPTNVSAIMVDNGIKISWDEVDDAVSYNVVRKEPEGRNYWTLIDSNVTGNNIIDTSVTPTVKYQYAVVAVDENGLTSDYSEPTNEIIFEKQTNY